MNIVMFIAGCLLIGVVGVASILSIAYLGIISADALIEISKPIESEEGEQ